MLEKLYKKKVIRSFLSLYSEKYWTQLVSHILEYGIILFKKKYTVSALSPEDICQIVEGLKKDEHIYDNIKTLKKTNNSKSSRQSSLSKGKGNSLSKGKGSFYGSTNRVRNGSSSVNSQSSNSAKKGINVDTHSKKNIHNIRKAQTPSRQRSTDMFKFKANAGSNNVNSSNSNNKYKTNFQSSSNSNSSKNIKTQSFVQQRPKSKTRTSKGVGSNEFLGHNTSNASSRKTILSMTQTSNLESNHNKNNTSIISAYSCYTTDINNNNNNNSGSNNMMTIKHKQGSNNAFHSTHVSTSINNNVDDNKLIHFNSSNSNNEYNKQPKLKAESKIKALIENDKKKYMQQQKYTNLSGTLKPLSTENSNIDIGEVNYVVTEKPIIDNLNTNTNPIKEDEYDEHHNINNNNINNSVKSKTTTYPIKNESSIISLEDKLNGLTMKLSKLNASINNNNSTLQNMQPLNNTSHQLMNTNNINNISNNNMIPSNNATSSYPSYLKSGINYRLDNLELNIGNTPLHTNQFINTTEGNNDEDYLGEDQIDLVGGSRTGMNIVEESNNGDNMEMRCYRKTQDDNNSNH
jgi:hypothetical protein